MKAKTLKSASLTKEPKTDLISLAAAKLKGRVLFPEKVESAKRYLQNVTFAKG